MEFFDLAKSTSAVNSIRMSLIVNLMLGCIFFANLAYANQLQPYDLHYRAEVGGMKIEARHQLKQINGQYSAETQAKNFLGKITEKGNFEISENGEITPLNYTKRQKTLMGNRSMILLFDWASNSLLHTEDETQGKIEISQGQFDRLSLTQQIRLDLAKGKKEFTYTIIRKGELKKYHYRVIGNEAIVIGENTYNSLLVERMTKDSSKKTSIWFALDWDLVILKMETFEKNSKRTLVLDQGKLNGNSIIPLKNMVEI